jgi:uncharacterized protein involved in type VI secretion and phage assembly
MVQFDLQRPIRLSNRMLFWTCVGLIEKLRSMGKDVWDGRRGNQACTVTAEGKAEVRRPHAGVSPPLRTVPPVPGTQTAVVEAQSGQS